MLGLTRTRTLKKGDFGFVGRIKMFAAATAIGEKITYDPEAGTLTVEWPLGSIKFSLVADVASISLVPLSCEVENAK
jgi:hypothetical protein